MRCPKCHYISFGRVDRCRNCGYEFSLAVEPQPIDLPIQTADQPVGPFQDLVLGDVAPSSPKAASAASTASPAAPAASRLDLPLFTDRDQSDDAPLITAAAAPRQPLSVRRAPLIPPKPRFEPSSSAPMLDDDEHELLTGADEEIVDDVVEPRERDEPPPLRPASARVRAEAAEEFTVAPTFSRLIAGVIDVLIISSIDAGVVIATLRVLGLGMEHVVLLPPVPMALFLGLLNGGYLATFTAAGGQTIGKMAAGIRVVAERPADDHEIYRYRPRVTLGAAVLRAAAYLVSLLPVGLGFAAILLDKDGRALHDRLAETRVVRA